MNKTLRNGKSKKQITRKNLGGSCLEFEKQKDRNKHYQLRDYVYPTNFIIFSDIMTINSTLSEPIVMNYIIQAHALKHIDSFGIKCDAGEEDVHIHDIYDYDKDTIKMPDKSYIYKQILQRHIDFINPIVKKALSQEYIQDTLYNGLHNKYLPGLHKNNIFNPKTPITMYFFDNDDKSDDKKIISISGRWKKMESKNILSKFNQKIYDIIGSEIPKNIDKINNEVNAKNQNIFEIFQIVKTKLKDIPPFWFRCLQNDEYNVCKSIEN